MTRKIIKSEERDIGERGALISPYHEPLVEKLSGAGAAARGDARPPRVRVTDSWFQGGRAAQGLSTVVGDGSTAPLVAELIRIEAEDQSDAQIITVAIAPAFLPVEDPPAVPAFMTTWLAPDPPTKCPIVALLEFGAGGTQHQAEVDVGLGTSFNLACSFLRVRVRLDLGLSTPLNFDTKVGGFCTRGPTAAIRPPTRTRYMDPALPIPGAGGSRTVRIPPFARSVQVYRNPAGNPITLMFSSATMVIATITVAADQIPVLPVPADATLLAIVNTGAGALTSVRMVFELAL